jgi:hypothetical protein
MLQLHAAVQDCCSAPLVPHAIDNQYKALLLCLALVQQLLAVGSLYKSPLLSYVAVRCIGRHGAWRAPSVMASIL